MKGKRKRRVGDYIPDGTYKVVCTRYERFTTKMGSEGIGIVLKIIEPSKVRDLVSGKPIRTRGRLLRYTFWMTHVSESFNQRDASALLGRSVTRLKRITTWVGQTCEIGVKEESFLATWSVVQFFNSWKPENGSIRGGR